MPHIGDYTAAALTTLTFAPGETTKTAADAAAAIGCTVSQIAKSIIFRAETSGRAVLVIASGVSGATANIPGFDMKGFWGRSFEMANTSKALAKLDADPDQLLK